MLLEEITLFAHNYAGDDIEVQKFCDGFKNNKKGHLTKVIYSTTNANNSIGSKIIDAIRHS